MIVFVEGDGGPIDISAADQILDGSVVGQELKIVGQDNVNTVQFDDGNNLSLNGSAILGFNDVLSLMWDGFSWIEIGRNF
jgi:hypothetical protein